MIQLMKIQAIVLIVIKILLTTEKSLETPYLICLNASQTDFNDAGFPRHISEYTPSAWHGQVS